MGGGGSPKKSCADFGASGTSGENKGTSSMTSESSNNVGEDWVTRSGVGTAAEALHLHYIIMAVEISCRADHSSQIPPGPPYLLPVRLCVLLALRDLEQ